MAKKAKEIYLYYSIYSFIAEDLISTMEQESGDIKMRVNSPGGSVYSSYGIYAKMLERSKEGRKNYVQVDGMAASGAGFLLLFADKVTALNVSRIMWHRADIYVDSRGYTDAQKAELTRINSEIRTMAEKKVPADIFLKVTGVSYDDMFAMDKRIDVEFSAKQAMEMGLIDEVVDLTPEEAKAMADAMTEAMALYTASREKENSEDANEQVMDYKELKAKHPEVYAQIFEEGVSSGKKLENERVKAWAVFMDIDPEVCKNGIKGTEPMTKDVELELLRKSTEASTLKSLQEKSPKEVNTPTGDGGKGGEEGADGKKKEPTAQEKAEEEFLESIKFKV